MKYHGLLQTIVARERDDEQQHRGVVGSVAASFLLDRLGRRGTVIAISPFAVILGLASMAAPSMHVLLALRSLQSVAFSTTITALSAWYIEFLPTSNRGMLMAAYSLGWPVGRAVVILTATLARTSKTLIRMHHIFVVVRAQCL